MRKEEIISEINNRKEKRVNPIRQGDVLLRPIVGDELEALKKRRMFNRNRQRGEGLILASGEATGHHHRVRESRARMRRSGDQLFLVVPPTVEDAELTHEEHSALPIPPGTYEIQGQREMEAPRVNRPQSRPVYD